MSASAQLETYMKNKKKLPARVRAFLERVKDGTQPLGTTIDEESVRWLKALQGQLQAAFLAGYQAHVEDDRTARWEAQRAAEAAAPPPPPPGPVIMTLQVLGGALTQVPCYESHFRGRNWMAKIQPNAHAVGGWDREFAKTGRGKEMLYLVSDLFPGNVIEFGADYYTSFDKKKPFRKYCIVLDRTEEALKVSVFDTPLDAWNAREGAG